MAIRIIKEAPALLAKLLAFRTYRTTEPSSLQERKLVAGHEILSMASALWYLGQAKAAFLNIRINPSHNSKLQKDTGSYDSEGVTSKAFAAALDILAVSTLTLAPLFFSTAMRTAREPSAC